MKKCCWLYANEKLSIYSACFIGKTVQELVDDFNKEVEAAEITQDKIYYREALINAFEEKSVDVSAVVEGAEISIAHCVRFDEENRALIIVE